MHSLAELDHRYVWHPFTQMRDWLKHEPIVIVSGKGAVLKDAHGRKYLDANSSIWTNLHGHQRPEINQAIQLQLKKIAHSSALGLANEPASQLARELILAANPPLPARPAVPSPQDQPASSPTAGTPTATQSPLAKVFFSDNGSTAIEAALKLAYQFVRRSQPTRRARFLSLQGGYHGDTVGAVSLGHIELFHSAYKPLLFPTDSVLAPYCYRCPFNKAKPQRADARQYRKCRWECIDEVERKFHKSRRSPFSAWVIEPLIQGAAGMIPQPEGWLNRAAEIARAHHCLLIADEVMTGFGRACSLAHPVRSLFASHLEGVQPDFLALAKGMTGGFLPMAATLTTQAIFDAFLGEYADFKTFFHGHSYTGNQLGSAASLASLHILNSPASIAARHQLETNLTTQLQSLWSLPRIGDIRQVGLIAGIELVQDWKTRQPFPLSERAGIRVCEKMAQHGVLTRPIGNVIVLMPPYCTTPAQLSQMVSSLARSITEVLP